MKDKITAACINLFSEQGYLETTVDDICAKAQVSPAVFADYFSSKDETLELILEMLRNYTLSSIPNHEQIDRMARTEDAKTVLGSIFFKYAPDDQETYHKIVIILMREQYRTQQAHLYMRDHFLRYVEEYIQYVLTRLMQEQKIPPVDAKVYARLINSINTVSTMEYAHLSLDEFYSSRRVQRMEILQLLIDKIIQGQPA